LSFAVWLIPATAFADNFLVLPTELEFGAVFVGETTSIDVLIINISGIPQTPHFSGGTATASAT
jgi:hypothetical protein